MKLVNSLLPDEVIPYLRASILVKLYKLEDRASPPISGLALLGEYERLYGYDGQFDENRPLAPEDVEVALHELLNEGLISAIEDDFADPYFAISDDGIGIVSSQVSLHDTIISKYDLLGDGWLRSVFKNAYLKAYREASVDSDSAKSDRKKIQAEADTWEPLPVDRAAPEYVRSVEALDNALSAMESDNGYAANHPEERDHVVWSLRQGLIALKEKWPSLSQIRSLILEPLQRATSTLKDSASGLAGLAAQEAVKEFIKSLFK